jgi:ribonucleotide reductase alpha subunit
MHRFYLKIQLSLATIEKLKKYLPRSAVFNLKVMNTEPFVKKKPESSLNWAHTPHLIEVVDIFSLSFY